MYRIIYRTSECRHTIYMSVVNGVIRYAPTLFAEWIGRELDALKRFIKRKYPKSFKCQQWTSK